MAELKDGARLWFVPLHADNFLDASVLGQRGRITTYQEESKAIDAGQLDSFQPCDLVDFSGGDLDALHNSARGEVYEIDKAAIVRSDGITQPVESGNVLTH